MKNLNSLLPCVLVLIMLSLSVHAEEVYIQCPLDQVKTEIVSPLPEGWWQSPQIWPLQGVRIQVIGGEPTLVCLYRAYENVVSVMHINPQGMECAPEGNGFRCSSAGSDQQAQDPSPPRNDPPRIDQRQLRDSLPNRDFRNR